MYVFIFLQTHIKLLPSIQMSHVHICRFLHAFPLTSSCTEMLTATVKYTHTLLGGNLTFASTDDETELSTHTGARHLTVVAR